MVCNTVYVVLAIGYLGKIVPLTDFQSMALKVIACMVLKRRMPKEEFHFTIPGGTAVHTVFAVVILVIGIVCLVVGLIVWLIGRRVE